MTPAARAIRGELVAWGLGGAVAALALVAASLALSPAPYDHAPPPAFRSR